MVKQLPKKLSEELFLKIDYLICRFMNNKEAYKTDQNDKDTWFTIKKIQEEGLHPQYHFHIRFNGKDKVYNKDDVLDFDFYINEEEFSKISKLNGGKQ